MAPNIGGTALSGFNTAYASLGDYKVERQLERVSAGGTRYQYGAQRITWTFTSLTAAEYDWLVARIAATAAELWTDSSRRTAYTITSCALLRPTFGRVEGSKYLDVKLTIEQPLPLVA